MSKRALKDDIDWDVDATDDGREFQRMHDDERKEVRRRVVLERGVCKR